MKTQRFHDKVAIVTGSSRGIGKATAIELAKNGASVVLNGRDQEKLALAKPGALVMHPGPMNRGVEIASDVADGPTSVILNQVTNGVAVRMAVLYLLLGGSADENVD